MVGKAIIGVYAGNQINMASVGPIIQEFAERVASHLADETAAQLCHDGFLNTYLNTQMLVVFFDTKENPGAARDAVRGWGDAKCVPDSGPSKRSGRRFLLLRSQGQRLRLG